MLKLNLTRISRDVPDWARPLVAEHEAKERAAVDKDRLQLDRKRAELHALIKRERPKHTKAVDDATAAVQAAERALADAHAALSTARCGHLFVIGTAENQIQRIEWDLHNSADPAIDEAYHALFDEAERTRMARPETWQEPSGQVDDWGRPLMRAVSNHGAFLARLDAIRGARHALEALKQEVGVDVSARIAAIVGAIPPLPGREAAAPTGATGPAMLPRDDEDTPRRPRIGKFASLPSVA